VKGRGGGRVGGKSWGLGGGVEGGRGWWSLRKTSARDGSDRSTFSEENENKKTYVRGKKTGREKGNRVVTLTKEKPAKEKEPEKSPAQKPKREPARGIETTSNAKKICRPEQRPPRNKKAQRLKDKHGRKRGDWDEGKKAPTAGEKVDGGVPKLICPASCTSDRRGKDKPRRRRAD